jgi:cyclin-dependent kinase 8/11
MRPGDLPAKEGEVFAIKKFKPDKEGDVQTYAGISQSGAREIMVCRLDPWLGQRPKLIS